MRRAVIMVRKKYAEEEKLKYVKEYLESDLSMTQFCNVHQITRSTIYLWLNWYNEKNGNWLQSMKKKQLKRRLQILKKQAKR